MPNEQNDAKPAEGQDLNFTDIGLTGLKRFSGYVYEEFLKELHGNAGTKKYKEMGSNDATVGAILFVIKMLCRQVEWRVQAASEDPRDIEAKEFLESCMNDMSQTWIDTIDEILSFIQYGYSAHERVYKIRAGQNEDGQYNSKHSDGKIGWRKFPIRSQDSVLNWDFDENGGIKGMWQLAPPTYKHTYIPMSKMLLFRTTIEKNNPEGKSCLRTAYRAWYLKKNVENIEGIGIERDLAGLPVIMAPPEIFNEHASEAEKQVLNNLKKIVTNIRRDEQEGVVMPLAYGQEGKPLFDLKLLSTGGTRQFDTDKTIRRYDQAIATTLLADFILLGHEKVGSFALASSKTNMFATAIGGFLDIICSVFNRFAVPELFKLNGEEYEKYPEIKHGDLESADLDVLGTYLLRLSQSGMPLFPNPELEKYLMKVASLPEPLDLEQSAPVTPEDMEEAKRLLEEAASGKKPEPGQQEEEPELETEK